MVRLSYMVILHNLVFQNQVIFVQLDLDKLDELDRITHA